MKRTHFVGCLVVVLAAGFAMSSDTLAEERPMRVRRPVEPGVWYSADPSELRTSVQRYFDEAESIPVPGRVVACIVPHDKHELSGPVTAHALKPIQYGQYDRVIVLAPSNYVTFRGCSIASVEAYRTPLGDVPIDTEAVQRLSISSWVSVRSVSYRREAFENPEIGRTPLHEREHAIEVVLPYLQVRLGPFKLVPILISELNKHSGGLDDEAVAKIGLLLGKIADDRTLVVVCSDFTRYGGAFGYTPFRQDITENIGALDYRAFGLIQNRDYEGFRAYVKETDSNISGITPILCLMKLLTRNAQGVLLGYDTSGHILDNPRTSVSYGGICFFDPTLPTPQSSTPPPALAHDVPDTQPAEPKDEPEPTEPPPSQQETPNGEPVPEQPKRSTYFDF